MARQIGRPLLVVYVIPSSADSAPLVGQLAGLPSATDAVELERWLRAELDQVVDPAGLSVHVCTRHGKPTRELAALAVELSADALVIGASARFWHQVAGSVPGWLASHARCTVIVVP
jgi:nucleotide-binding universal stress UspA family protein